MGAGHGDSFTVPGCERAGIVKGIRSAIMRIGALFRKEEMAREFDAELASHLEMHVADNMRAGMTEEQARRDALIRLGGVEQTKEKYREQSGIAWIEALVQDLRFGLRMLRKNPGFTAIAVLTLALGIGATTAIFSVVYGVLLRPLPYPKPEQIVRAWEQSDSGTRMNFADPNFDDMQSQNRSLEGFAEYGTDVVAVSNGNESIRARSTSVSRDFFVVMGSQPNVGRGFAPEEQRTNAAAVAVVSQSYWKQQLGGTLDLASVHLRVNGKAATVVGVMPAGFRFPEGTDIWIPREIYGKSPSRSGHNWRVVGRLREGVSVSAARADLTLIAQRLKKQYGQDTAMSAVAIEPLREAMTGSVRPALMILLGASSFLLLIACANVVNMMLSQAAARERELCVRSALGATRHRLVRQSLTESLLLALLGGVLGALVAYWGSGALLGIAPKELPRLEDVSMSFPVLLFSLAVVFAIAGGMGIACAYRVTAESFTKGLNEGTTRQAGSVRKQRVGWLIVAGQIATTLVLLVGAGLLGRSLLRALSVNPGFRAERVVTMELELSELPDKTQRAKIFSEVISKLQQIPGVEQVGGTNALPLLDQFLSDGSYAVMNEEQITPRVHQLIDRVVHGSLESDPALLKEFTGFFDDIFRDREHTGEADYAVTSEGFFTTLAIPLVQGRLFDEGDSVDAPHVAVINESLARERWPKGDAIGHTVEFGNMDGDPRLLTIVGVVGDVREHSLEARPRPTIYVNYRQRPQGAHQFMIVMRAPENPAAAILAARQITREVDPNLAPRFSTLSQIYSASLAARRFSLALVSIFSSIALLLAISGIYGVTAYGVAQRTKEIGVRMAVGATARDVMRLIIRQGLGMAVVGVIVGILGASLLTKGMQSLLFEVSPSDPTTIGMMVILLLFSVLISCWFPARKATRVDPMVALRYE